MQMNNNTTGAYAVAAIAWISVGAAISVAVNKTGSVLPLLAFALAPIPSVRKISSESSNAVTPVVTEVSSEPVDEVLDEDILKEDKDEI